MTQGEKEVKAGETNDRKKGLQFSAKKGQKCILLPISEWPAVLVLCNFFVASKVEMSMFNRVYFSRDKCQIIKCWFYWSGKNDGNHH